MVLIVVWISAVMRRVMQKGVRRVSLLIFFLLLGWINVRLLKYQMPLGALSRYFWYAYYPFLLALPLALLLLAWAIDQPEDRMKPPAWFLFPAAAGVSLVALVFTNDLHNWVFRLDLSRPDWAFEYGYGPGYYLVMAFGVATALAALVILLIKSGHIPRKSRLLYPLAPCVLLAVYGVAFLLRVPLIWKSDVTMVYGLFALLLIETSIRAGMIPVNTKYAALFTHSPLAMRIIDSEDNIVLSSISGPLRRDDNTLLFATPIAGGRALWQEDMTALNRLHQEMEESVRKLTVANAMLAEEESIQRAVEEENARTLLLSQLEAEIAGHTARLSNMIENRESAARIVLLVCYIKRRCNLFFRDRETQSLPSDELAIYIDELTELAGYAGLQIVSASEMNTSLELRRATLLYDVFYGVVDWAISGAGSQESGDRHMLASLGCEDETILMRLQYPGDVRLFQTEEGLAGAIASAGGVMEVKNLGDAVGINLSFPNVPQGRWKGGA